MSVSDLLGRLRGSARSLDAPIRAIVHEVLREQGYASPAEVQALRDEARDLKTRLDAIDARIVELGKKAETSRSPVEPDPRIAALEGAMATLREELEHAQATLHAASQAALSGTASSGTGLAGAAPLTAASRGDCKVEGCGQMVRSKGFCSAHYQQWRRGTLKGYVTQDGSAEIDGRVVVVGLDYAGERASMSGNQVLIEGRVVVETALA